MSKMEDSEVGELWRKWYCGQLGVGECAEKWLIENLIRKLVEERAKYHQHFVVKDWPLVALNMALTDFGITPATYLK